MLGDDYLENVPEGRRRDYKSLQGRCQLLMSNYHVLLIYFVNKMELSLYESQSGNGQINDENYKYFMAHIQRPPVLGVRVSNC